MMQLSRKTFSIAALILCFSAVAVAQAPRGITPEDYYGFEFLSDPNISPDGKLVAYTVTKVDRAQNRRSTSIWMVATDGSRAPWQFTTAPQSSSSPRWSPDGKTLAFLSSRPESTAAPTTKIAATCGITRTLLTSSMTRVGLMIGGRISGSSMQGRARPNRSLKGMIGTTAIRNGHLTERVSLLSQTERG